VRRRIAIFGGGRVGTAMSLEVPGVPLVRRGEDCECDVACVCWPAHAIRDFAATHPLAAATAFARVSFCAGVWAVADGASEHGCCYVRAVHRGDRAGLGKRCWRVGNRRIADILRVAGLGVVCGGVAAQRRYLWEKCMYHVPLALAVRDAPDYVGVGRLVTKGMVYAEWYDVFRDAAVADIGSTAVSGFEPRILDLLSRTPRGWEPAPSPEELRYIEERICADS